MGNTQKPVFDVKEAIEQYVARAMALGASEEDVRIRLGTLAQEAYRKQRDQAR